MATYGSETGVEALNAHIVGGYTATTIPTSTQIAAYLSDGYAALNVRLTGAGYSVPAPINAACYGVLARLNNLFAAATAEEAVNLSSIGDTGEMRSTRLWARYNEELAALLASNLALAGLTVASAAPVRRSVRSMGLRRRDGYADYFDPDNVEYAASTTREQDLTLLEPWRLGDDTEQDERDEY